MASVRLVKGTKQYIPVDIADRTELITDLTGSSPTFSVENDLAVAFYTNQAATAAGMRISCLVDTSAAHPSGLWPVGHYKMFVKFTSGSQIPVLLVDIYIYDT